MAHVKYNSAKTRFLNGGIDLDADDIRVLLLMSNTTCDTENDGISTVGDFTTLDNFDGTGYTAASGIALASEAVVTDDANDRAEFDAADVTGLSLGDGTRQIQGLLLIKFVTDVNSSYPIVYINSGGFPVNGSNLSGITWNSQGILQLA